jgi:HK97 gp10 family phage protein
LASIHGIARTNAALLAVAAKMRVAAPLAAKAGAEVVGRQAIARVPRDTGATAASIRVQVEGDTAHVGPSTDYARFTEYGTVYIPGQHYMEQAAEDSASAVVSAIATIMKAAVEV